MSVSYNLKLHDPFAHIYLVTCQVSLDQEQIVNFSLPDWIPGSYMIREFSKNITEMTAFCNDKAINIEQINKSHWRVKASKGELKIVTKHYAFDYSVRTCFFDQNHAYFNGTSLFLKIQGVDENSHFLTIEKNSNALFKHWTIGTSLKKENTNDSGFGTYVADNYNDLIDHPVEIAEQTKATFIANGIPHDIYIQGKHNANMEKICADLKTICEYELNLFGKPYPIDRYVFLIWVMENGYGGLEHKYSTSLMVSRQDLITTDKEKQSDEYIGFLGLCSHEYFHTWNVKRLKPKAYVDMSLNTEAYTRLLWWFEGITSYYDDLILLKSGKINLDEYLKLISKTFNRILPHTGKEKQSIADSSLTTWNKFYKQDENAQNAIVSYYAKGAMVAFALDLTIQKLSDNKTCLTDVLLHLWQQFGINEQGIDEFEVENILLNIFNLNCHDFFQNYIYGTNEPDYQTLFNDIGIELSNVDKNNVDIGVMTKNNNDACQISRVFENKASMLAGLSANDTLVAIDGIKVTFKNLKTLLKQNKNKTVKVHAFRQDWLFETELNLNNTENQYQLLAIKTPNKIQLKNQNNWLK